MEPPRIVIVEDAGELGRVGADLAAKAIAGRQGVSITAATGESPMGLYAALAAHRRSGLLETGAVTVFQLDEYVGLAPGDRRSLLGWMRRSFLEPLGVPDEQVVALPPDGESRQACAAFDLAIEARGGLDVAILGLGRNGHLGFNEPPSGPTAPTREVRLSEASVASNATYWPGLDVPDRALTAGMSTILAARRLLLIVTGERKRQILERLLTGLPTPDLPASLLRGLATATILVDQTAWPEALPRPEPGTRV